MPPNQRCHLKTTHARVRTRSRTLLPISLFLIFNAETQRDAETQRKRSLEAEEFSVTFARRAHETREFLLRKGNMNSITYKNPLFREGILSFHGVTYVTQTQLWSAIFSASSRLSASLRYFASDRKSLTGTSHWLEDVYAP